MNPWLRHSGTGLSGAGDVRLRWARCLAVPHKVWLTPGCGPDPAEVNHASGAAAGLLSTQVTAGHCVSLHVSWRPSDAPYAPRRPPQPCPLPPRCRPAYPPTRPPVGTRAWPATPPGFQVGSKAAPGRGLGPSRPSRSGRSRGSGAQREGDGSSGPDPLAARHLGSGGALRSVGERLSPAAPCAGGRWAGDLGRAAVAGFTTRARRATAARCPDLVGRPSRPRPVYDPWSSTRLVTQRDVKRLCRAIRCAPPDTSASAGRGGARLRTAQ